MEKLEAIILAAGFSSRAGSFKPALKIGGEYLILRAIRPFLEFCERVIVVTGYKHELIEDILKDCKKACTIYNENYELGMFGSAKKGIAALCCERFFIIPGDYPFLCTDVLKGMLAMDSDIIIPRACGKSGHPVLLKSSFAEEILKDVESTAMRDWLARKSVNYFDTDDEGVLFDIDTRSDYIVAEKRIRQNKEKY